MGARRLLTAASLLALTAGALPLVTASPATAVPVTVVTGGDVSADGSSGWAVESRNTGTGAFVAGTATPPLGTGSYFLKSTVTGDKQFLHLTKVAGVPLAGRPIGELTELSFASWASDGTFSPYVNIPVHSDLIDTNDDGIADGSQPGTPGATGNAILVFDAPATSATWSARDTLAPASTWRLTRKVVSGGVIPLWTYKTYAEWTSILTDGTFNPVYGDIQWVIGDTSTPAWGGREGWVDDINVSTTTESGRYDLEEGLGSCPVAIDTVTKTFTLTADCTTSQTLLLRDGWTLDGAGYTITAVDPSPSVDFTGAVLTNELVSGGASMNVHDVHVVGSFDTGCSSSLFGIRFDGARGSLIDSTLATIRYGAGSGCQSGNSVDITNLGGPTRLPVTVDNVSVTGFQKTGIRANGNVALKLTDSTVDSSELDLVTASNSLQISRGARAYVARNTLGGNDWDGDTDWSATGVLLYGAEDVTFTRNVVTGPDTDFGLYVSQDPTYQAGRTTLTCNLFQRDAAADPGGLDVWNTGVAADPDLLAKVDATGNTVEGFATAYDSVVNELGGSCASGPVHSLAVDGGAGSVDVSWSAADPLPYAPVSSYTVTLVPGGASQTVSTMSATFSGLDAGKEYSATVVPVNGAGPGVAATASGTTDAGASPTAPGPVTGLAVTGSASGVTASWNAAAGATGYEATLLPGGQVQQVAGTSASFAITPGKEYTVSVVASNVIGWGPTRSASIDTALPRAPRSVTAVGGVRSIALRWKAPASASALTSYVVTVKPRGAPSVVRTVAASALTLPYVVGGLERATSHTVWVKATNAFGSGPATRLALAGTTVKAASASTRTRSGTRVNVTGRVLLSGKRQGVVGQQVRLYTKVRGSSRWKDRGVRATTRRDGRFSLTYRIGTTTRWYVVTSGQSHMAARSSPHTARR